MAFKVAHSAHRSADPSRTIGPLPSPSRSNCLADRIFAASGPLHFLAVARRAAGSSNKPNPPPPNPLPFPSPPSSSPPASPCANPLAPHRSAPAKIHHPPPPCSPKSSPLGPVRPARARSSHASRCSNADFGASEAAPGTVRGCYIVLHGAFDIVAFARSKFVHNFRRKIDYRCTNRDKIDVQNDAKIDPKPSAGAT